MRWFLAAGASLVCFTAVVFSTFVPLRDDRTIEYLFVWPGGPALLTLVAIALAALGGFIALVLLAARRQDPAVSAAARSGWWLAPLTTLALVAIGIAPAVPGVGVRGAVVSYFFYDLRWWWFALVIGWVAWRADRLLGSPVEHRVRAVATWSTAARLLLFDGVLFAGVMIWAVATTPHLRFSGKLVGDEPKYIRYCEIWYQGGGFAVTSKVLMTDQPLDAQPAVLRNFALFPGAVADEARALASDLRAFAADPRGFKWNRVRGANGFPIGKHGPTYQVHQAGMSFLLFPGYFVDRYLLGVAPGYQGEFPVDLVMTNVILLLMYGACAVALFRLLRNALGLGAPRQPASRDHEGLALLWAAIGVIILPITAFAFQFYPEVPAALGIILITNYLLFHARQPGVAMAAFAGVATGGLTWLHPRFILLSAFFTFVAILKARGHARRAFVAATGVVVFLLLAFDYRVSGSWLPNSLWAMPEQPAAFNGKQVPANLLAYAFHRMWGLAPHAPLLLAVVGGWFLIARRSAAHAMYLAMVAFALGIPAAGHTLSAAGTTPGRLVLAVLPLFIWPVAVLVRHFWRSAAMRTATVIAVVLSLESALAYNWSAEKIFGPLRDVSLSGWRPNLAFPVIRDLAWSSSPSNMTLVLALIALVVVVPLIFIRRNTPGTSPSILVSNRQSSRPVWLTSSLTVALVVLLFTAATMANGRWMTNEYLLGDVAARRAAAQALTAMDRCRVCFSTARSALDWTGLKPNPARALVVDIPVDHRDVAVRVAFESGGRSGGFGRVLVEFGDGTSTGWSGVVEAREFRHSYSRAGKYRVSIWSRLADGREDVVHRMVDVGDQP